MSMQGGFPGWRRGLKFQALTAAAVTLLFATACPRAGAGDAAPAAAPHSNLALEPAASSEEPQVAAQLDSPDHNPRQLPLDRIQLPPGFSISMYASDVPSARELSLSPAGVLYAGSRDAGNVYALLDNNADYYADELVTLARDKWLPVGVCFHDGALYYSEVDGIYRFKDIEAHLKQPKVAELVTRLPDREHHGWKFIRFGPDGKLYVPVGVPCNICETKDPFGAILRMDANGKNQEVVARGMRNTVGFAWQPGTGVLYWTDNGRDLLGNDLPPDELNRIAPNSGTGAKAPHFGFPYWHGKSTRDPEFGKQHQASEFVLPVQELGPHVAALGMRFCESRMFPPEYQGAIFIAEHGSWNRDKKLGYRVSLVTLDAAGSSTGYSVFCEGWLQADEKVWGRPADVEFMPDGSLLVSDDYAGCVYRITYKQP
jgi:glucose/arabinose dehydrogenase